MTSIPLLLCIAVSHILVQNPFYGAGVFLFASIIKAYYLGDLSKLRKGNGEPYLSKLLLALVFLAGLSLAFLYQVRCLPHLLHHHHYKL